MGTGCVPLYRPQTQEELATLNLPIVLLPESRLMVPEFDGKDMVLIFYYRSYGGFAFNKTLFLYNNGLFVSTEQIYGGKDAVITSYMDIDSFKVLTSELNKLGYFSITNENIDKKKYIEYRACCLGIFFLPGPPSFFNPISDFDIGFHLTGIDHRLCLSNYLLYRDDYIKDVQILKICIDIISVFLYSQTPKIQND